MKEQIKNIISLMVVLFTFCAASFAQSDTVYVPANYDNAIVYASDTLPVVNLPEVNIYDISKYSYLLHNWKYRRTIHNVKKAYPYAVIANNRLNTLDSTLATISSKKDRKAYTDEAEAQIMEEFKDDMRHLTIKQGIILVKLVNRETGQTSYEVVKEIRGGMIAFFWQGLARFYGNNLKLQYDPQGDDKVIEDIVMAMQWGLI